MEVSSRFPIFVLCLTAFFVLSLSPSHAAGAYVGLAIGNASSTVDKGSVEFDTEDWSPSDVAWRVFAGYQTCNYFSVEGGYIQLGKARVATQGGDFFETTMTGYEITPVVSLPIGKAFSVYGRGGLVFWQSDLKHRFTALGEGSEDKSGNDLLAGLGARYAFSKRVAARAEYSLYAIDKAKAGAGDYGVISLAGVYSF